MDDKKLLSINSKRLRKHFYPLDPILGDTQDPDRFLFKIKGVRKAYLPSPLRQFPLLKNLIKSNSLSKFIRSNYFKQNFNSVSQFFIQLDTIRLKYDFLYWINRFYPRQLNLARHRSLIRFLQKERWSGKPIRLIIRKYEDSNINFLLSLFSLWFKAFDIPGLNVLNIASRRIDAERNRKFLLSWSKQSNSQYFKFYSKNRISSSIFPLINSKYWFSAASAPNASRGLDFSILIISDMHKWRKGQYSPHPKVIPATFPVVRYNKNSAIILDSGPLKRSSYFAEEFKAASSKDSQFKPFTLPWFENPHFIFKFDFYSEKIKFFQKILKYRNRRIFPPFRHVSGKYIYSLWQRGLSLEAIHWYASQSLYYTSRSTFHNLYPPV